MREILFRGKSSNGTWYYGSLIHVGKFCCILPEDDGSYDYPYLDADLGVIDGQAKPVIPETVGQWTGLFDKTGKRIFEGDIMRNSGNVVEYLNDGFCINGDSSLYYWTKTEIVGNIHDKKSDVNMPITDTNHKINDALMIAWRFSQIDGAHHKAWCIDQMVRALCGDLDTYEQWVGAYTKPFFNPNTKELDHYNWDAGIAP